MDPADVRAPSHRLLRHGQHAGTDRPELCTTRAGAQVCGHRRGHGADPAAVSVPATAFRQGDPHRIGEGMTGQSPATLRWLSHPRATGVTWGVPWPRGTVDPQTPFALRYRTGEVPVQSWVT